MRSRWLAPVVVLGMALLALWAWPHLPERVPVHWNFRFEVDRWGSRWEGVGVMPLATVGLWALAQALRRIDPFRRAYAAWEPTYWLVINLVVLLFAVLECAMVAAALGWPVSVDRVLLGSLGVFFMAMGNYLPRVRRNWWMGIRTPWTLSSERVWRETHRLGGRTFVLGGLVTAAAAWLPRPVVPWVALTGLLVGGFIPVVWSYVLWRREAAEPPTV